MDNTQHIQVWNNCLQMIQGVLNPNQYETWFAKIKPVSLVGSTFTIEVPSEFFREYLETHYIDLLSRALRKEIGNDARLMYKVQVIANSTVTMPAQEKTVIRNKPVMPQVNTTMLNPFVIPGLQQLDIDPQLNPNYSFANFIEGECNRLGRSAGLAIAKSPGKNAFNPLFIYGGSGLGKTHLAQAIGIEIAQNFRDKIVLYVTANRFMTQYIDAVNVKNKLTDFLNFYQMIDVLILDDVQEFAEKQGTQNAFFHIFNHLHQSGKQLILTSDKAPVDLMGLEQRLLSRFKWGLSVELTPPSYNTRLEILKAKSLRDGIELPEDVLTFLASKVVGSVREIEGTLASLLAHATLCRETITMDLAKRLTDKIVSPVSQEISLDRIQDAVCGYFGITRDLMLSKTRKREIVQARQIAMYLGRSLTKVSLAAIGTQIGGKDHATVLHACNTVSDLIATDRTFKQYVADIEKLLKVEQ
ncbi:MAG: chromosomal replication initiator protein DnaA [Bacteroidales bacterium]|nr:chromosomal replication initiator protein DnaA [Bacteroidales bacterium]